MQSFRSLFGAKETPPAPPEKARAGDASPTTSLGREDGEDHVEGAAATAAAAGAGTAAAAAPETRKQRLKRHFKRWWLAYVIGNVIFLAIFLPLLFVYAFPAIVQRIVDDTALLVESAALVNPTPDSVQATLQSYLKIPAGFTVHLEPLNLDLYNTDTEPDIVPYLNVTLPDSHLKGNASILVPPQQRPILSQDQFHNFLDVFLNEKYFILAAKGTTNSHIGALNARLTLNKQLNLTALDKLSGFGVEKAQLLLPPAEDGTNLLTTLNLPDHSKVTYALGNITVDLRMGDVLVGSGFMNNVTFSPGNNSVPMRAKIDLQKAIANLKPILAAEADALKEGKLEITTNVNSSVYNGQHLTYYERVLQPLPLTTRTPILPLLTNSLSGFMTNNGSILSGLSDLGKMIPQNSALRSDMENLANVAANIGKGS